MSTGTVLDNSTEFTNSTELANSTELNNTVGVREVRSETSEPSAPAAQHRNRARAIAKDVIFAIAGIAGVISVVWLVASLLFGYSFVVFQTGSMAPTMPTGAIAIIHRVPAAEVRVGDVVTVADPGHSLPITHRVVSISPDATDPARRSIQLKGDANKVADQDPYSVTTAGLVVASAPQLGSVLVTLRQPLFLGIGTLILAFLVAWAFWPSSLWPRLGPIQACRVGTSGYRLRPPVVHGRNSYGPKSYGPNSYGRDD